MIGRSAGASPTRLAGTPSWLSSGPNVGVVPRGAGAGATGAGTTGTPGAPWMGETGSVLGAGVPTRVEAPLRAVAAVCSTAPTLAGLVANCWIMFSAGTPGTDGGITGSAAADALRATAAEHSPAAAIALAANSFAKRDMRSTPSIAGL